MIIDGVVHILKYLIKMKRISILFIFIFLQVFSQKEPILQNQVVLSFNITSLKLSYSKAISNKIMTSLGVGLGTGFYSTSGYSTSSTGMSIENYIPMIISQNNRFYYNREKRYINNKSTQNNSGNYLGLKFRFNTGNINVTPHNSLLSEIHWGLQRSLGSNWFFDFNLGIGYLKDFDTGNKETIPVIGVSFGYNFL